MTMTSAELRAIVSKFALTSAETAQLLEKAQDRLYWQALCPTMTIGPEHKRTATVAPDKTRLDQAINEYWTYGHCAVSDAFAPADIEALRETIFAVHTAGWPMIFASVYDLFWTFTRSSKADSFLQRILGSGYQPTLDFWVNYVPAARGGAGFAAHKDDVRPGHHAVNCWIPLTPANTDNGCIYVIEKSAHIKDLLAHFVDTRHFTSEQVCTALSHVRALPTNPGSFLAWPNDTIHWGGMYARGDQARLALTWHLTASDHHNVDPHLQSALVPDGPLPEFEYRLRWACELVLHYRGRNAFLERFEPLARHMLSPDPLLTQPRLER
jgi:hypothetical protein